MHSYLIKYVNYRISQLFRRRKINYKRAKRDIQEKVQTELDSEAVHEEELLETEAEEETISDDILAYEISCQGLKGMSMLKTSRLKKPIGLKFVNF